MDTVELEVDEDEDVVDGPDDEVEPERERSGFGLLLLLTAALTIVRLVFALRAEGLTSLPDEIGYLGDAWLLGRGDPAPPMGWAPFYPASYPVLLAPVTAFTDDTATIATAARVLNVLLLAGLAPLCWALLGRLGRLRPGARAVAAVAATATPGLWVAAQRAWPDALLAVVWVAALLALWALARPGPLWRRVWFGPAVGLLLAAHSRFVPVAALAVFILVLRLAAPGRDESGRTTSRVADAVNLVGMAVVAGVGLVLDAMVDSRWEWIADSAAEQLFDEPAETLRHVPGSLVGQGWYALVATFGLAGIGVATLVTVAWRARRRDQALWTEPLPLVAATAVAGAFGVQLATAIQIGAGEGFFDTSSLDLLANGRYQEVVLVPLVLAGIARLARRVQGPLGLEVGVAVVALVLAVVVGVSLGTNPPVVDQGGAPGTTWLREVWPDQPVVAPTILLLVVLAGFVLLRPAPPRTDGSVPPRWKLGLRAAAVPILALAALSIPGAERAEEIVAAGRARDAVAPDLDEVRDALDGRSVAFALDRSTAEWVADVGWALAPEGVVTYEPVRQRRPSELLVIAPADDGEPGERVPAFEGLDPAVELAELPIEDGLGRPLVLWELVEG